MAISTTGSAKRLGRQSTLAFIGTVVAAVATFALTLLVTNTLPDEDGSAGAVFMAIAFFNIVLQLGLLGTASAQVRYLSSLRVAGRFSRIRPLVRAALIPALGLSALLAVLIFVFAPQIAEVLSKRNDGANVSTLASVLRAMAPILPVAVAAMSMMAATRGFGVIRPTVYYNRIGRSVVQLVAMVIVALAGWGPAAVIVAWMAPYALPAAAGALSVHRQSAALGPDVASDTGIEAPSGAEPAVGEFWRFALPQGGVEFFRALVRWQDTLLIGILLGIREAGIYASVTSLVKIATMANQAVVEVSAPQIAEAVAADDPEQVRSVYQQASVWMVLAVFPVYLTTALFAEPLARLFREEYVVGASALVILSIGRLITTATGPVESVLVMSGQSGSNLLMHLVALVVNVVLNIVLVPKWGLDGAAVAWVASILVTNLGPYARVAKTLGVHPFGRETLVAIPVTILAFVLPAVIIGNTVDVNLGWAIVSSLAGAGLLALWAWPRREALALDVLVPGRK